MFILCDLIKVNELLFVLKPEACFLSNVSSFPFLSLSLLLLKILQRKFKFHQLAEWWQSEIAHRINIFSSVFSIPHTSKPIIGGFFGTVFLIKKSESPGEKTRLLKWNFCLSKLFLYYVSGIFQGKSIKYNINIFVSQLCMSEDVERLCFLLYPLHAGILPILPIPSQQNFLFTFFHFFYLHKFTLFKCHLHNNFTLWNRFLKFHFRPPKLLFSSSMSDFSFGKKVNGKI